MVSGWFSIRVGFAFGLGLLSCLCFFFRVDFALGPILVSGEFWFWLVFDFSCFFFELVVVRSLFLFQVGFGFGSVLDASWF